MDNKIESYASNLENGIPIVDFLGQEDDQMLEYLERYLIKSFGDGCDDVRDVITRDFSVRAEKLNELKRINLESEANREEYIPLRDQN